MLNSIQRTIAAENHTLIGQYLQEYGLSEDAYYDIAVFGYLRAIMECDDMEALSTVVYREIKKEIESYEEQVPVDIVSLECIDPKYPAPDTNELSCVSINTILHGLLSPAALPDPYPLLQ